MCLHDVSITFLQNTLMYSKCIRDTYRNLMKHRPVNNLLLLLTIKPIQQCITVSFREISRNDINIETTRWIVSYPVNDHSTAVSSFMKY
jgi:hypothetical protein